LARDSGAARLVGYLLSALTASSGQQFHVLYGCGHRLIGSFIEVIGIDS
jgi:hypothetical protein